MQAWAGGTGAADLVRRAQGLARMRRQRRGEDNTWQRGRTVHSQRSVGGGTGPMSAL